MLTVPRVEGDEDENDHTLDFYDESDENLNIYPELNPYLSGVLPASLQQMTTTPDVEMQEATELVDDDEGPSADGRLVQSVTAVSTTSVADPQLPFFASSHRHYQHAKTDESLLERSAEKPAATINEEDYYVYVRTLTRVTQEDISKIEQVGIGKVKFIGDEHVMTYRSFLQHGEIIRSDTQTVMNLSSSQKKKIYPRDENLFLRMTSGNEIQVKTRSFKRPTEKPAAAINERDYVYVRTLKTVAQADISKIEQVGKGSVNFIGDEHVMTYGRFLRKADIIRSDTREKMSLSCSEKREIYYRDGQLCLMDLGEEIEVETCPFKRPTEQPAAAINEEDYFYVRTLTPVAQADISKIERIGKCKFIGDEHVMTYGSFLRTADIIRSDTRKKMSLSSPKKKEIYSRDGNLFLMVSGGEIQVETCPVKRPDKKRTHEDITKHNESEEDAAPSAKRKKIGEEAEIVATSSNRNRLFRTKANIRDDKNGNTENDGDYNMGEVKGKFHGR
jgi:hypothetical protein